MRVRTGAAVSPGPMWSFKACVRPVMMTLNRTSSGSVALRMASLAMVEMSWQMPETSWPGCCSASSMIAHTADVQAKGYFQCWRP